MRCLFLLLTLICASCDAPSPAFKGAPAQRITIGKSTFDVRVKDRRAEAIRVNAEWAPRLEAVSPRAAEAIERVSGCEVARLRGDAAMIVADLKCGKKPVPSAPRPRALYCAHVALPVSQSGPRAADLLCEPA